MMINSKTILLISIILPILIILVISIELISIVVW